MDDTDELVSQALADSQHDGSDNRPNIYWDDNIERWVYRASSLGNCLTSLIATRLEWEGFDAPEFLKLKWAEGNRFESTIIRRFCEEHGFKSLDNELQYGRYGTYAADRGQIETEIPVGRVAVVRCHPDDVVEVYRTDDDSRRRGIEIGDRYVLEVKKFAKSAYDQWKRNGWDKFPYYAWQFSVEMASTGLPGVFCVGVMETEEDRPQVLRPSDTDFELVPDESWEPGIKFIDAKFYDTPPFSKTEIIKRVMSVETGARKHDEGEGMPEDCEYQMFPCPFFDLHDKSEGKIWAGKGQKRGEVEILDHNTEGLEDKNPVQYWTHKLTTAQAIKKKYEAEEKEAKAKLKGLLIDKEGGQQGDWWGVGRYQVKVGGRVGNWEADEEKLQKAGKNMDYYEGLEAQLRSWQKRGKGSTWVEVKERDKGEEG